MEELIVNDMAFLYGCATPTVAFIHQVIFRLVWYEKNVPFFSFPYVKSLSWSNTIKIFGVLNVFSQAFDTYTMAI